MLDDFYDYLQLEKRYSKHTLTAYKKDLSQVRDYLLESFDLDKPEGVSTEMLRSWMVSLMEEGASAKTVNRKMSAVRSFFKWAKKFREQDTDPTSTLTMPKIPKRLPVYVEEESMEKLDLEGFFPDTLAGLRDKTIVELLYQTGMRCAELIGLKNNSVDFQQKTVKVLGKRNKERIIPVGEGVLNSLKQYLNAKSQLESHRDQLHFFLTDKGRELYPKLVYNIVNNYLGTVSSLQKKSPHVLRHSFATHMLNRGADLNAIKELLGHASLAATQVYTHNSIEKLKDIHRKAHPNG